MKYVSLITSLFLFASHTCHTMKIPQKKITELSKLCLQGIEQNNPQQVKNALLAGADVNSTDSDGKSLFYLACEKKRLI